MELFHEPLPPVMRHVFVDHRDLEAVVFDDDGFPIFQVELEEIP